MIFNNYIKIGLGIHLFLSTVFQVNGQVEKHLTINHVTQECSLSCWAACNIMLNQAFFTTVFDPQCKQLCENNRQCEGCCTAEMVSVCECETVSDINYTKIGLNPKSTLDLNRDAYLRNDKIQLIFNVVTSQIDSNKAIVAQLQIEHSTHLVVISGYSINEQNKKMLIINNPSLPGPTIISPKQLLFKSPYTHLNYIEYCLTPIKNDNIAFPLQNINPNNQWNSVDLEIKELQAVIKMVETNEIEQISSYDLVSIKYLVTPFLMENSIMQFNQTQNLFKLYRNNTNKKHYYVIVNETQGANSVEECGIFPDGQLQELTSNKVQYVTSPSLSNNTFIIDNKGLSKKSSIMYNYNSDLLPLNQKITIQ